MSLVPGKSSFFPVTGGAHDGKYHIFQTLPLAPPLTKITGVPAYLGPQHSNPSAGSVGSGGRSACHPCDCNGDGWPLDPL